VEKLYKLVKSQPQISKTHMQSIKSLYTKCELVVQTRAGRCRTHVDALNGDLGAGCHLGDAVTFPTAPKTTVTVKGEILSEEVNRPGVSRLEKFVELCGEKQNVSLSFKPGRGDAGLTLTL
jgi:hypothetical protein